MYWFRALNLKTRVAKLEYASLGDPFLRAFLSREMQMEEERRRGKRLTAQQTESAQYMLDEALAQLQIGEELVSSVANGLLREARDLAEELVWELTAGAERRRPRVNSWSSLTGFLVWIDSATASRIRKICQHLSGESRHVALWEVKRVAARYKIAAISEQLAPGQPGKSDSCRPIAHNVN